MTAPLPSLHRVGFDRAQTFTRQFARDLKAGLTEAPAHPPCMACAAVGVALLVVVIGSWAVPAILGAFQ